MEWISKQAFGLD